MSDEKLIRVEVIVPEINETSRYCANTGADIKELRLSFSNGYTPSVVFGSDQSINQVADSLIRMGRMMVDEN